MLGILVIAMPIPIIVNSFTRQYQRLKPASKYWEDFQEPSNNLLANNNAQIIGLYDYSDDDRSSSERLNGGIDSPIAPTSTQTTNIEISPEHAGSDLNNHHHHDNIMVNNNLSSVSIEMTPSNNDHSHVNNTEL